MNIFEEAKGLVMRLKWILFFWGTTVFALPQNPNVISQDAQILFSSSQVLEIAAQDGTVIEWNDFSIEMPETVRFTQPSLEAVVLNRVTGPEMSQILGKLEANGQVILINQNGVLFGKEAEINTASFIATTLDLQNDFFAKPKIFKGTSNAQIINLGSIVARGGVALIASDINNQGSLHAEKVALIGSTYTQDFECQFPNENGSRITHSGRIDSPGGRVHLMADEIYVFGTSEITTSDRFSGGRILIGSALQGKDPSFPTAKLIWVEEGALFFADAWEHGQGGQVILFSEGVTDFAGKIFATGDVGGFAEVSGHYLIFSGIADLRSPLDKAGTLLLDPTDITIAGANLNSSFTPGFPSFPFACFGSNCLGSNCSGMSNISRIGTTNAGFPASTINVATIGAQLALGHVVIDSTGGVGGSGNITWMQGFNLTPPLFPVTPNDLILRAPATGTVSIRSNVQNPGTGRVIISSDGPLVEINRIGNPQSVSFGADDGLTEICAPNATVNVQGAAGGIAQIGFYTVLGGTSVGPIRVCCRDLNVLAGAGNFRGAQVGHGRIDATTGITVAATIDVVASQNITIIGGPPGTIQSHAKIGHGVDAPIGGFGNFTGNINVQANGASLVTPALRMFGSGRCGAAIGHGAEFSGAMVNLGGNIQVQAPNGSILMETNSPGFAIRYCMIGHGHAEGTNLTTLSGDVFVCCRGDLTLSDLDAGLSGFLGIGHVEGGTLATYTGNTLITVGGNITINAGPPRGPSAAGVIFLGFRNGSTVLNHTTQIISGGNFLATLNCKQLLVGAPNAAATSNAKTLIATGGNFTITASAAASDAALVLANADLAIAVGGNFTVTSVNGVPPAGNFVTSINGFVAGRPNDTRIYAGGSIVGLNSPSILTTLGNASSFGNPNYNVDFRAGGDIQLPNNLNNAQTGNIYLEADALLPIGALWTYTGGVITSICGIPTIPILCTPTCPSPLAGSPTGANSGALTPNGAGCFSAVKAPSTTTFLPAILSTTTGNITLHSAATSAANFPCSLDIGNDVQLITTSGNIEVYGAAVTPCLRSSFLNVTINQAIVTTGTVLIVANNDLTITSFGSIDTSGGNSPVTLVCDNQAPIVPLIGSGGFVLQSGPPGGFINTGTAPLNIYTANPNLNTINGLLNGQLFGPPLPVPGNFFTDTCFEAWCVYYCGSIPLSCATPPNPFFTIAYKTCVARIMNPPFGPSPTAIVDEFLVSFHPYNEFPGWMMRYTTDYKKKVREYSLVKQSPHMLRRRLLNSINHPKSWTHLIEDTH